MGSKKVGILTFHAAFNHGSMLQAWALRKVILLMGYDAEIINFRPRSQQYGMYRFPLLPDVTLPLPMKVRYLMGDLLHPHQRLKFIRKWRLYNNFLKDNLTGHQRVYKSADALTSASPNVDTIVTGSDQIWNTRCKDFSDVYYATTFSKPTKKIAYAPSLSDMPEKSIQGYDVISWVNQYDQVSVREERSRKVLMDHGCSKEIAVTLDPTLLLPADDYHELMDDEPLIREKYIYYYNPRNSSVSFSDLNEIGRALNMPVICERVSSAGSKQYSYIKCCSLVGPREFLNIIKNATMVCAESFHGVAFSIIFHKRFFAFGGDVDSRLQNILSKLGLEDRAVSLGKRVVDQIKEKTDDIDYADVEKRLNVLRRSSINYLLTALKR